MCVLHAYDARPEKNSQQRGETGERKIEESEERGEREEKEREGLVVSQREQDQTASQRKIA